MFYKYDYNTKKAYKFDLINYIKTKWNPNYARKNSNYLKNITTGDTETCTIKDKFGYIVMGQFFIDGEGYYCRHAKEMIELFDAINWKIDKVKKDNNIKDSKNTKLKLIMFFHNLSYDFFYLSVFMKGYDAFRKKIDGRESNISVLKVNYGNIEFRDSLALFDKSLAKIAKEYNLPILKGNGWDYDKFRTPFTKLTVKELEYGMDDVRILAMAIEKKLHISLDPELEYKTVGKLPLTKTGEMRYYRRIKIGGKPQPFYSFTEAKKYKKNVIDCSNMTDEEISDLPTITKNIYKDNTVFYKTTRDQKWHPITILMYDRDMIKYYNSRNKNIDVEYKMCEEAFQGGFTHGNRRYLGDTLYNVKSYDLTSAYPSVMLVKKFVYSYCELITSDEFNTYYNSKTKTIDNEKYGFLMKCKFKNVTSKEEISTISFSKTRNAKDVKLDNGRILSASEFEITIIDTDLNVLNKFYNWESIEFIKILKGEKRYLLLSDLLTTSGLYTEKSIKKKEVKINKGTPLEAECEDKLKFAKTLLNAIYGCSAMNIRKYTDAETYSEFITKLKSNERNDVSVFAIGMQVTSYVREQILTMIAKMTGEYFVYSDTDSIKFLDTEDNEIENMFLNTNIEMQNELNESLKRTKIDYSKWDEMPNQFDLDGVYYMFKTIGAKRYITVQTLKGDIAFEDINGNPCFKNDNDEIYYINETTKERYNIRPLCNTDREMIHVTTAGIKGHKIAHEIWKNCLTVNEAFCKYTEGLEIAPTVTDKKTTKYIMRRMVNNEPKLIETPFKIKTKSGKVFYAGWWVEFEDASFKISCSADVLKVIGKASTYYEYK